MHSMQVKNITKQFNNTLALDHVSFSIDAGTIFGLLGPNGAGKTTLMRILVGILGPDAGRVQLGNTSKRSWKERIGYLPEDRGLYPKMKVRDLLHFMGSIKGIPTKEIKQVVADGIQRVGVEKHAEQKVQELSKGNQQRVQLLICLMHKPDLLILDEPFTGLDPIGVNRMKEILQEEIGRGATVIISTHRMEDAEELCQSIALIHQGRLICSGDLKDIKQSEGHEDLIIEFDERATPFKALPEFAPRRLEQGLMQVALNGDKTVSETIQRLSVEFDILGVQRKLPKLHDIFVDLVGREASRC